MRDRRALSRQRFSPRSHFRRVEAWQPTPNGLASLRLPEEHIAFCRCSRHNHLHVGSVLQSNRFAMKALACSIVALLVAETCQAEDFGRSFVTHYCVTCHGPTKPKGDLRLDNLSTDLGVTSDRDRWLAAMKRIKAGEMPPKGKSRPADKDVRLLSEWIDARLAASRKAQGRVVLRRLNRVEYENTIRDLLGIHIELQELLPEDTSGQWLRQRRRGFAYFLVLDGQISGSSRPRAEQGNCQSAAAAARQKSLFPQRRAAGQNND